MEEPTQRSTLLEQHKVPIIDIAHITQDLVWPVKSCSRQAAQKLHRALMETGYAFLVNHGVTENKLQAAYCKFDTFCSLPEETKGKYTTGDDMSRVNHYTLPGNKVVGRLFEFKHEFHINDLQCEDLPENEVPGFTQKVNSLIEDFQSLAVIILQFIAIGCDIEPKYFLQHHNNALTSEDDSYFQMVYYPPMDDCIPLKELASREYNDLGTLTIMSQDSEVGMEILHSHKWVPVGYLPGALLLRAGLCLQKWTGNAYIPTTFRMTVPNDCNVLSRSRHSAMLHVFPKQPDSIEPMNITTYEFHAFHPPENKRYCNFRRIYTYIRRKLTQICR